MDNIIANVHPVLEDGRFTIMLTNMTIGQVEKGPIVNKDGTSLNEAEVKNCLDEMGITEIVDQEMIELAESNRQ